MRSYLYTRKGRTQDEPFGRSLGYIEILIDSAIIVFAWEQKNDDSFSLLRFKYVSCSIEPDLKD